MGGASEEAAEVVLVVRMAGVRYDGAMTRAHSRAEAPSFLSNDMAPWVSD